MVNVKPDFRNSLEVDSMKKFILEYKRYSQKCPRQLLRSLQQLLLEDHLKIICMEDDQELEEVMELARDEFISLMLKMHQANLSRKWRLMIKNAKMEKADLTLSTFVQSSKTPNFGLMPTKDLTE